MNLRHQLRSESGIAIVTTVIIGTLVMVIGLMMLARSTADLNSVRYDRDWQSSLFAADSGINEAIFELSIDTSWSTGVTAPDFALRRRRRSLGCYPG